MLYFYGSLERKSKILCLLQKLWLCNASSGCSQLSSLDSTDLEGESAADSTCQISQVEARAEIAIHGDA